MNLTKESAMQKAQESATTTGLNFAVYQDHNDETWHYNLAVSVFEIRKLKDIEALVIPEIKGDIDFHEFELELEGTSEGYKAAKSPFNPSRRAIKRVRDYMPVPHKCPYCESEVLAKTNDYIYNGRTYGEYPWVYVCSDKKCRAYVGIHPFTNIPLGTLADSTTRDARTRAKKLWYAKTKASSDRNANYRWLARLMGIPKTKCHFGMFNAEQCEHAIQVMKDVRDYKPRKVK